MDTAAAATPAAAVSTAAVSTAAVSTAGAAPAAAVLLPPACRLAPRHLPPRLRLGSITKKKKNYSVQSVTSVEPVGTASPLAFQNCRGRPLNRPGSKVMINGMSQFFGRILP